jgi:membrane-bound inhibitor of C-type lysozyme
VAATETAPRAEAAVERFTCENGLNVQLRPLGQDQLELHLDDKRATLVRAVSGSGERYVATQGLFGRGAEWHQKGGEAFFSFTDAGGRKVETPCRAMN